MLSPGFQLNVLLLFVSSCWEVLAVTTLNDGGSFRQGKVDDMTWQASGVLTEGCKSTMSRISSCFEMSLSSNPKDELDPGHWSPRQRDELHFPAQVDGSTWQYEWKHYLASGTGSTSHFFHLIQVFSNADAGPLVTLDAFNGDAMITDNVRHCGPCGRKVPMDSFEGRTTYHLLILKSGSDGSLDYLVIDADNGAELLSYSIKGYMGYGVYVKFGVYRSTEDIRTGVTAYVGDYTSSFRTGKRHA